MVIAYHVIFSTYGFWLPNDPRGSWSDFVGAWELVRFGKATKVATTRSVAAVAHDRRLRLEAKEALDHPPVAFTGRQALAVGHGFAQAVKESEYMMYACTILPEHVHAVIGQSTRAVGRIVGHLKGRATQRLAADGLWPDAGRPVWGRKCWKVFLREDEDVRRAVAYVEANPDREHKPRQRWSFVAPLLAAFMLLSLALPTAGAELSPAKSRLGMNLSGPADWSTEMPFVDVFRLSREWISQRQGAKWGEGPKIACDAQGWPKALEKDCWAETPVLTYGHGPSGQYVCLYDGDGTLEFNGARSVVSRAPGRIVVDVDAAKDGVFIQLRKTNPANPVRNIRFIMPGFEDIAKEPFYPVFLDHWRGFNTFRFMDWMQTNGSKVSKWEDRPTPESATFCPKSIPVEVMVDLCNRLKINPWFCMPHLATDDYVAKFAEKVKATLDPSLKVYVEYSNEVWNNGFEQCRYAQERAKALGLGPKERPWEGGAMYYAQRSVEVFSIWEKAFGGRERLVRTIAWQAAGGEYWSDQMVLGHKDTAMHVDALAIAPYISFGIPERAGDPKELSAATVARWSLDQLFDHLNKKSLPECLGWVATQKKVADKYHLRLLAYEAGQHLVGVGGGENNEAMTKLFLAANRNPRMGALYTKYLDGWKAAGGDLMCIFASTSSWSKWGSWGLAEYMTETEADQPKLKAVMEWNRKNPRP